MSAVESNMSGKKHIIKHLQVDEKLKKVLAIGGDSAVLNSHCESLTHVGWSDDLDPFLKGDWTHLALFAKPSEFEQVLDQTVLWENIEEGFERRKMDQVGMICKWIGTADLLCRHYFRTVADQSKWLVVDTNDSVYYPDRLSWL